MSAGIELEAILSFPGSTDLYIAQSLPEIIGSQIS